jgi:putative RecB family exonuclease
MYQQCPLKYKLCYRDKIKRDVEGVEAFLGTAVHDTLKKCYDDARLTRVNTLAELLAYYDKFWQQNWHDAIIVTKKDLGPEHYRALGKKLIETYYRRYAPFDTDMTIGTEMMINFRLEDSKKHRLIGYIDRLARTREDVYEIHDYKTSAHLPTQEDADNDRQLGLYHIGIQRRWPDIENIRLVWHYLAFDRELVSSRSGEAISKLVTETGRLIEDIEATTDFIPQESNLCEWCEYPDLCPLRKHLYQVESLPVNEYLTEPGVVLVNKYAELKEKAADTDRELAKVKEAIFEYAREQQVEVIKGSDRKVRIHSAEKLKFPGKNEVGRQELDSTLIEAGKWPEVSQLDTTLLARSLEDSLWDKELIDKVMKHGRIETVNSIHISKLKDEEE